VNLHQDAFRSFDGTRDEPLRSVPGAMLAGPDDRSTVIEFEAGRSHVSVDFTAGGAWAFFATPLVLMRNEWVPLDDLWSAGGGSELRARVIEAVTADAKLRVVEEILLERLRDSTPPDPAISFAAEALASGIQVSAVCDRLGLLPRTFRRRFVALTGLTPKRFARVQRLRRVAAAIGNATVVDWASVAAHHGYYDQSHLVDEFRDLVGVTPSTYLRQRIDGPTHLRVDG
jgi:AraC-like DNA-binding protein